MRRDTDGRMVRLRHDVAYPEAIAGGVEQHDETQQRDALAQKGDSHDRAAFTWKRRGLDVVREARSTVERDFPSKRPPKMNGSASFHLRLLRLLRSTPLRDREEFLRSIGDLRSR